MRYHIVYWCSELNCFLSIASDGTKIDQPPDELQAWLNAARKILMAREQGTNVLTSRINIDFNLTENRKNF